MTLFHCRLRTCYPSWIDWSERRRMCCSWFRLYNVRFRLSCSGALSKSGSTSLTTGRERQRSSSAGLLTHSPTCMHTLVCTRLHSECGLLPLYWHVRRSVDIVPSSNLRTNDTSLYATLLARCLRLSSNTEIVFGCVFCSLLAEHCFTTGDVGTPASVLRERYPRVCPLC